MCATQLSVVPLSSQAAGRDLQLLKHRRWLGSPQTHTLFIIYTWDIGSHAPFCILLVPLLLSSIPIIRNHVLGKHLFSVRRQIFVECGAGMLSISFVRSLVWLAFIMCGIHRIASQPQPMAFAQSDFSTVWHLLATQCSFWFYWLSAICCSCSAHSLTHVGIGVLCLLVVNAHRRTVARPLPSLGW